LVYCSFSIVRIRKIQVNKNKIQIITVVTAVVLIGWLFFYARGSRRIEVDSGYRTVMGTLARVVVIAENSGTARKYIESAFEELQKIEALMSVHTEDSEISRVNREAGDRAVAVSGVTFEVLQKAMEVSRLSEGAFDITVGPLVELWRSAGERNSMPTGKELAEARSKIGYEKVILDEQNRTARFAVDGMRLDLGGIAKGYGIDKAVEAMRKAGAIGGMVDVGGDIRCFGPPSQSKKAWRIALQDPAQAAKYPGTSKPLLVLNVNDKAVATSGDYQRFAIIDGKKYSHIMNGRKGTSAEGLSSVTIIAQTAVNADALATAVSVMGAEKGLSLAEKLEGVEAILIPARGQAASQHRPDFIASSGAAKYIRPVNQ